MDVTIKGLDAGETCTFSVKAKCGAPGFEMMTQENLDAGSLAITFFEYSEDTIQ